jgi:FkbM family methyltransferase
MLQSVVSTLLGLLRFTTDLLLSNDMALEENYFDNLLALRDIPPEQLSSPIMRFLSTCGKHLSISRGQVFQDIFAMFCHNGKTNGFFVDFGATDGMSINNTYILEKHFNWTGILAEPAKLWHDSLRANRRAKIDTRCVWSKTGENLEFKETSNGEYSTLSQFVEGDLNAPNRKVGVHYNVETISLNDLLLSHDCPKTIDYMSIDTEGSEVEILSHFDFEKYHVSVFTVEHAYTQNREKIRKLMASNGYLNVFPNISKWDDWFVHKSMFGPKPQSQNS